MEVRHEIRACLRCGVEHKVELSDARYGFGKYCSDECRLAAKTRHDDILALLPASQYEVGAALDMGEKNVAHALRRMIALGIVHMSGLKPETVRRAYGLATHTLVFSPGPQPDPKAPTNWKQAICYFYDRDILAAMPGTVAKLADRTGFPARTVWKRLQVMREELTERGWRAKTFIYSWRRPVQGSPVPVHQRGPGKDAPCKLGLVPKSERDHRYYVKTKKSKEYQEDMAAKRLDRAKVREIIQVGDPLINAMFGAPAERKGQARPQTSQ